MSALRATRRHRAGARVRDAAVVGSPVLTAASSWIGGPDPAAGDGEDPAARPTLGVLFCHGFTGSPASMRPWAEAVAAAGHPVSLPRLPGHGTRWQEMCRTEWTDWYAAVERAHHHLAQRCDAVVVAGLSMGGALALRLAQRTPVAGLMLVNPAIDSQDLSLRLLGHLPFAAGALSSIGGDIALPGADEVAYDHTPLAPARSMTKLWRLVRDDLGEVRAPVLLFTSRTDHVVDASSAELLVRRLPDVQRHWLENSYHVATLDHDAGFIERESLAFLERLQGASATSPGGHLPPSGAPTVTPHDATSPTDGTPR